VLLSVLSVGLLAQVFGYQTLGGSWSLRGFERGGQHSAIFGFSAVVGPLLEGGYTRAGRRMSYVLADWLLRCLLCSFAFDGGPNP